MSADDLLKQTQKAPDEAAADTPKPEEKEEKKSPIKAMFVAAAVLVGAIFLAKKFKGKFPNKGDEPIMAP